MAGGGIVAADNKIKDYPGGLTWRVFIVCLFACQGGMLFGVSSMLAHADTAYGPCLAS